MAQIPCPFCQEKFPSNQLVSHCRQCPAKVKSGAPKPTQQQSQQPQQQQPTQQVAQKPQQPKPRVAFQEEPEYQQQDQQQKPRQQTQQPAAQPFQQPAQIYEEQAQETTPSNLIDSQSEFTQNDEAQNRVQCEVCGRFFNQDRIDKHKKTHKNQRQVKVFVDEKRLDGFGDDKSKINIVQVDKQKIKENLGKLDEFRVPKTPMSGRNPLDPDNVNIDVLLNPAKPNFNPIDDELVKDKPAQAQAGASKQAPQAQQQAQDKSAKKPKTTFEPVGEFRPPQQGPVDEVEGIPIGGERIGRSPKGDSSQIRPEMSGVQEERKDKHRHKHRHDKKSSKASDEVEALRLQLQQFQMMQTQRPQQQQQQYQPPQQPYYQQPSQNYHQGYPGQQYQQGYQGLPPPQFAPPAVQRFCVYCGVPFAEGARFCGSCGAKKLE